MTTPVKAPPAIFDARVRSSCRIAHHPADRRHPSFTVASSAKPTKGSGRPSIFAVIVGLLTTAILLAVLTTL
jgi:hypothetical protein